MKFIVKWVSLLGFSFLVLTSSSFGGEFSLELKWVKLKKGGISLKQEGILRTFVQETAGLLPPSLKKKIGRKITVEFQEWDSDSEIPVPDCTGESGPSAKRRYGRSSRFYDSIELNSGFIAPILQGVDGTKSYKCGHGNMYRLAQATLLHELAHLYDLTAFTPWEGVVSSDWYYRKMTGWGHHRAASRLFFSRLEQNNHDWSRSPNIDEYRNVKEHFAVNMEYFLLDPKYACERPVEYEFFVGHFEKFTPYSNPGCKVNTVAYFHFLNSSANAGTPVDLNPDRIYAIHSLLASGGQKTSDQYGHYMYRFVICGPNTKMGPDCLKDVESHAVVDYRLEFQGSSFNNWKALTGEYDSKAFLYAFPEVIHQYNDKFRDLTSLPIQMDDDEKRRLVYKFLEQYWDYRGKYYYITNNCATEAARLLKVAIRKSGLKKLKPITPEGMQDDLIDLGLADKKLYKKIQKAIKDQKARTQQQIEKLGRGELLEENEQLPVKEMDEVTQAGYFFPSSTEILEKAFALLKFNAESNEIKFPWKKMSEFVKKSLPTERKDLFNLLSPILDKTVAESQGASVEIQKKVKDRVSQIYAALYCLEDSIHFRKSKELQKNAVKKMESLVLKYNESDPEVATPEMREAGEVYQAVMKSSEDSSPSNHLNGGYAIPPAIEGGASVDDKILEKERQSKIDVWMGKNFGYEKAVLDLIKGNVDLFETNMIK